MPAASSAAKLARGFPPVIGRAPRVLLLGSLPGRASIEAGEYYAQRQNTFWRIVEPLCGIGIGIGAGAGAGAGNAARTALNYSARLALLKRAGIALWDVLAAAERDGSLDADIVRSSHEVNDIAGLLSRHRGIRLVGFNGQTAAAIFRQHVAPELTRSDIEFVTLPSTSPAYASLSPPQKYERWHQALAPHIRAG